MTLEQVEARFLEWYSWRATHYTLDGFVFTIHRPDPPWEAWVAEKVRMGQLREHGTQFQVTAAGAELWAPTIVLYKLRHARA